MDCPHCHSSSTTQWEAHLRVKVEVTMALHRIEQHGNQRLQPFAADPVGRFPEDQQRLAHRIVVDPRLGRGPDSPAGAPPRSRRIACLR
jgi:hypothetical protein